MRQTRSKSKFLAVNTAEEMAVSTKNDEIAPSKGKDKQETGCQDDKPSNG